MVQRTADVSNILQHLDQCMEYGLPLVLDMETALADYFGVDGGEANYPPILPLEYKCFEVASIPNLLQGMQSAPYSTRILYLWGTLPQEPTGEYYQKFWICCRKKQISHPQKSSHGSCTLQRICHCMLRNIQTMERLMRKFTEERLEIQILQNATRIVSWHWSMAWRIDWIQATLIFIHKKKANPNNPIHRY